MIENILESGLTTKEVMSQIGLLVKKERTRRNYTLEELSKELNISRKTLSSFEKGTSKHSLELFLKVLKFFDKLNVLNTLLLKLINELNEKEELDKIDLFK